MDDSITNHYHLYILSSIHKFVSSITRPNSIALNICQRIAQTRTYTPLEELIWEAGKGGVATSLRQVVADRMLIPVERVVMAKYLEDKFEWLVIDCTQVGLFMLDSHC